MSEKNHYVYFAECLGFIKIGKTRDVKARVREMQPGNPFPIKVLGYFECSCDHKRRGKKKCFQELELQTQFSQLRVTWFKPNTEWFHGSKELRDYIDKHAF